MERRYNKMLQKLFDQNDVLEAGKNKVYYSDFITFDIETTNIRRLKQSAMYMWSVCISGRTFYGRTWKDFRLMCMYINKHAKAKLVCYIHNFSFELQYLRSILDFGNDNVFLLDARKPLKATYGNIEFRCSYMLTNMSLRLFLDTMKVHHQKLKYNYSKYRYPWTKLTWLDYRYSGIDVLGLYQALHRYFDMNGDNIVTIPMTNTGFVRRDIKESLKDNVNQQYMAKIQPNIEVLTFLREAFRGGDTHGNRHYYGQLISNRTCGTRVRSHDLKSAYPAVMITESYPGTPFMQLGHISVATLERKIKNNFAILMRVAIYNVTQKNELDGCPYLSFSKCRNVQNYVLDNGRIVECDYLETTITDVDYRIIRDTYSIADNDFIIIDSYQSHYKKLPQCIRDNIMKYFKAKETLKHSDPELYIKSKNRLNAIYGMSVFNPLRTQYEFENNEYVAKCPDFAKIIDDLIRKKFMPYQWGVWVTCWCRYTLHRARKALNDPLDFLYCDTDSIKSMNNNDFEQFNKEQIKKAIDNNAYFIDENGDGHYLGAFEYESEYIQFIQLGAKKYCYRDASDNKLHLTLAGVSKSGVSELGNNIRNFKAGFIFTRSAGLTATYNDHVNEYVMIDGHKLHITSNVYLEKTTYQINLNDDFDTIIQIAKKLLNEHKESSKIKT